MTDCMAIIVSILLIATVLQKRRLRQENAQLRRRMQKLTSFVRKNLGTEVLNTPEWRHEDG